MTFLISLAGLSGAGKTTAITHFESLGLGQRVYLGEEVLKEINIRGLERSPANERSIRLSLREMQGASVLAVRATPLIGDILATGTNVFVDAIFDIEEYQHLQASFRECRTILLSVVASYETRSVRLISRLERPLTPQELKLRDEVELSRLRTGSVIDRADHKIDNEGTLLAFQQDLEKFWKNAVG